MNGIRRFMIQKHHTEYPHFDLRLEVEGILKSWIIPKRIPLELDEKRLAIEVGEMELDRVSDGDIIDDQYGVGKLEFWDSGSYGVIEKGREKVIFEALGNGFSGRFVFLIPSWGRKTKRRIWTLLKTA